MLDVKRSWNIIYNINMAGIRNIYLKVHIKFHSIYFWPLPASKFTFNNILKNHLYYPMYLLIIEFRYFNFKSLQFCPVAINSMHIYKLNIKDYIDEIHPVRFNKNSFCRWPCPSNNIPAEELLKWHGLIRFIYSA